MFCSTFYSYKGGVGRTLALANVAIEHAKQGKRVLAVDFDLEAPGLITFAPFDQAADKPGLVDFVQGYQTSGEVPQADRYIHACEFEWAESTFQIDVMPAGCGEHGYSEAFSSIDWNYLYEKQNGFLLMEDLRTQWSSLGYDYVYIDSRTGHTDSGGICTRQLPDLVAVVFFPNAQNLRGLEQTVPAIRASQGRPSPIETVFVASRVPRLDDEHGLLQSLLDEFEAGLSYQSDDLVVIEQYDSLSLLDQELFVLTRPTSGLAKQYTYLSSKISQLNIQDVDGAVAHLRAVLRAQGPQAEGPSGGTEADEHRRDTLRLSQIGEYHERDALVQSLLARAYYLRRDLVNAAIASDKALVSDLKTRAGQGIPEAFLAKLHQLRLRISSELMDEEKIIESATFIINSADASDTAIIDAIINLSSSAPERLHQVEVLPALENADARRLLSVARRLTWSEQSNEVAAALVQKMLAEYPDLEYISERDITDIQLPLISAGQFDLAFSIFEKFHFEDDPRLDILFNSAMAKWGRDRSPDERFFTRVHEAFVARGGAYTEPNSYECRAVVQGVLGKTAEMRASIREAEKAIEGLNHLEFSCWNFQNVSPEEFKKHLAAIESYFTGGGPPPAFLST